MRPSARITSVADARARLAADLVLPLTRVGAHLGLAEAVAQERIAGSWWSHPSGEEIFAIANALEAMPDVLTAKLLAGTTTFIDRALWPAISRVVADRARRDRALRTPDPLVQAVLHTVESGTPLRADHLPHLFPTAPRAQLNQAKEHLETRLLVHTARATTETGARTTLYQSWLTWMPRDVALQAAPLPLPQAQATLRTTAKGAALPMLEV